MAGVVNLFNDFDVHAQVRILERDGITTVQNFLAPRAQRQMLEALPGASWLEQPQVHGKFKIRQRFTAIEYFPEESVFTLVRRELQAFLNRKFRAHEPYPLSESLYFTEVRAQRYEPGILGISPHLDGETRINIIAILVLEGEGRFCLCDDEQGTNCRAVHSQPLDLILMRGPGFMGGGDDIQPYHFLDRIIVRRTTFALRHRADRQWR